MARGNPPFYGQSALGALGVVQFAQANQVLAAHNQIDLVDINGKGKLSSIQMYYSGGTDVAHYIFNIIIDDIYNLDFNGSEIYLIGNGFGGGLPISALGASSPYYLTLSFSIELPFYSKLHIIIGNQDNANINVTGYAAYQLIL